MERARLVYDEGSPLHRALADRRRALVPPAVEVVGAATGDDVRFEPIDEEPSHGPEAIARAVGGWRLFVRRRFPGAFLAWDRAHAFSMRNPKVALSIARFFFGDDLRPPTFVLARFVLLRLLGVVHFAAFASAYVQIVGLAGERGVVPFAATLDRLRPLGGARFHVAPTLLWFSTSDRALHAICVAGMISAALLVFDLAPFFALLACWVLYLSVVVAGGVFFHFQWDALLLEASIAALFLAPIRLLPALDRARPVPRAGRFAMRLLVFKLMFLSGVVKLASHDPTWRSLDALSFHFWTQPLPMPTSRFFATLPTVALRAMTFATIAIELVVPFFLFLPRRFARAAFFLFSLLQLAIMASGNYGFFNLLTIAISVVLLDDGAFPKRLRSIALARATSPIARWTRRALLAPFASLSLVYVVAPFFDDPVVAFPGFVLDALRWVAPFRSVNGYGLFASMTTTRDEITIEGSDGVAWKPYVFRYKPGDPTRAPKWVPLHMPRLDWMMWFAALAPCGESPWLYSFADRLGSDEPTVTALLADDPFAGRGPRFLRAKIQSYELERDPKKGFWRVGPARPYCE